ncbi:alanyl-tRNA synthetase [Spiroplasma sabaudiense Ar-1343]|uniref:Alanine--tRNA ligase n=1 Tax=Spiroplasma sabaudiense Ar-1343 TaxID=1276257 RepID=W6A9F6_9MOLU|nr:alanine--tRNA ligase [Spiroplasma sabaudiense]AHI53616.1 alanyl-tRNA synthetase [Spiroplasma sabaudiense Ar-1343]
MKKLSANAIRQTWIDFFKSKEHLFLPPVSLVPVQDPSLLWINSGVATLKPYFDGRLTPPSQRLTNSQKSIRTNDIENVGITARHQTMFEMLGNFSIGDYFKKEAILFAWELLTSPKWFDIPPEKLYITVFEDDEEAYNVWTKDIKISPDHIFKGNRSTNFWDVGQGPCGPNSEIFFDRGPSWDPKNIGPKLLKDDIENDRYIEIWNIVFSQFNNDGNNNYTELPRKNIDTGAGLERLVSIFQEAPTNFETDLFIPTIEAIENLTGRKFLYDYESAKNQNNKLNPTNTAFKVIADHIRAVTFAISDGVFPGNKDRGYIIRRLIRRSSVYGRKIGINDAFLYRLVDIVIGTMKEFYPYLIEKRNLVVEAIKTEENKFLKTLTKGQEALANILKKTKKISGKEALLLFESYGFPIELTVELANEQNAIVDEKEFQNLLEKAKEISRSSRKDLKAWDKQNELFTKLTIPSKFIGWETETCEAEIVYMFANDQVIQSANSGEVFVILNQTPFYAEKGGQAADCGLLIKGHESYTVVDVQEGPNHQNIHQVILNGSELRVGDKIFAQVDSEKRYFTMKNHSGTHILHSALREVLGKEVMQCGSYNDENGLRIDITFNRQITAEEQMKIQKVVDREIALKVPREVYFTSMDEAVNKHKALAFFTEKYDGIVRTVKFGDFSSELCGGTHVENTKIIEDLIITSVESKSAGVYRVHALTSNQAVEAFVKNVFDKIIEESRIIANKHNENKDILNDQKILEIYQKIIDLKINKDNINNLKIMSEQLKMEFKNYDKKLQDLKVNDCIKIYQNVEPKPNQKGVPQIELNVSDLGIKEMKALSDQLINKYKDLIIIICSVNKADNLLTVGVSDSLNNEYPAIDIFKNYKNLNPKGGGNKFFAQGKY